MSNYFELQNAPVLTTPSALTAPKITSIGYPGDDTAADPAGGQTITLTGEGFEAGASVIINNAAVGVVSVVSSTSITFTSPALSTGSYPVYVVNTDGGTAIAVPGIQYSGTPNWTTAAGSLGSYTETQAISNTVTATGDAPISYSLFSGTLPTGATLNSANGLISGTSPLSASPTTYTFTIRATDAQQQDTNRQFSLTINPDVVTWSSPANGTTYTSTVNSAISNVALSATAASGQSVSYTANALPTGLSISGSNITGTPTVVANSSTLLTATAATTNATATRTINWVISVASDPSFAYVTTLLSANNPASTFVTDASTNNFAVSVLGDTRPNNFGPYTPGYYSNFFDGNGDYLSAPDNAAFDISGSTSWCVECWAYWNSVTGEQNLVEKFTGPTGPGWTLYKFAPSSNAGVIDFYGGSASISSAITPVSGQWYHIVVCRDNASSRTSFFINGARTATTTSFTVTSNASTPLLVGVRNGGTTFMNGNLSNLRIVKGSSVYDPAQTTLSVPTAPLTAIANTSILTCQSNRFIDNSTNAFTITRNGDTQISGFDPFAPLSAYSTYGSGYFDGTGDYLSNIGSVSSFNFMHQSNALFTIECWVYPTTAQDATIIDNTAGTSNQTGIIFYMKADRTLRLFISRTAALSWVVDGTSTGTLTLNTWQHVVATYDNSLANNNLNFYINGVNAGTTSKTGNTPSTGNASNALAIGSSVGGGLYFVGYLSNLRITNSIVYASAFTPPTAPLTAVANTQLLTLQNNQPNNNNMFLDSSTNNFLITRNGNTTQGSFSPYGGGWSNYFDGNGDFLSIASNTAFAFGTGDFTVEAWIMRTGGSGTQAICQSDAVGSSTNDKWFFAVSGTGLIFSTHDAGGFSGTTTTTFNIGVWYHVAASRSSGTLRMFVNGVNTAFAATGNPSGYNLGQNGFSIGAVSTPIYWTGYISNLRVTKGTALYTSTFTPSTTPLTPVANTSLLTCTENRFVDDSGNNFTITRNGDVSVQRFNPFNPVLTTPTSYSGYFDGTGDFLSVATNSAFNMGSGDYTFEAWVYLPTLASINRIFSSSDSGFGSGYFISVNTSGFVTVETNSPSYQVLASTNNAVTANTWTHVAVAKQSGTVRVFMNGVQCTTTGSQTNSFDTGGNALQVAGSIYAAAFGYLTGYVSNARIVKGTAVYTSAFTPSTTPLTAVSGTSLLTLQNATFVDNSTNNFTITVNGNSVPRQFNPFGWTNTTGTSAAYSAANYGGSMYFDGTGDYLTIPNSTVFNVVGNFTLECWVYNTSVIVSGEWPIFGKRASNLVYSWIIFGVAPSSSTNRVFIIGSTNGSSWNIPFTTGSIVLPINQWNHIAIVRNGTTMQAYVNGVPDTSLTFTVSGSFFTNSDAVTIATSATSPPNFFPGYISNFRWINGTAVYTAAFAPPVAPLSFNANAVLQVNGTSAAVYDSAMMATYETAGSSISTGVIKKYGNSSVYFDGNDYLISPSNPSFAFGTGDYTIEAWVYPTSIRNGENLVYATDVTGGTSFGFNQTQIYVGARATGYDLQVSYTMQTNTWTHIAVARQNGTARIFANGTLVGSGTISRSCPQGPAGIGDYPSLTGNGVTGYLDDVRITRGVARYTANFTPPTTPFIGN